jgi:hypothetical protein
MLFRNDKLKLKMLWMIMVNLVHNENVKKMPLAWMLCFNDYPTMKSPLENIKCCLGRCKCGKVATLLRKPKTLISKNIDKTYICLSCMENDEGCYITTVGGITLTLKLIRTFSEFYDMFPTSILANMTIDEIRKIVSTDEPNSDKGTDTTSKKVPISSNWVDEYNCNYVKKLDAPHCRKKSLKDGAASGHRRNRKYHSASRRAYRLSAYRGEIPYDVWKKKKTQSKSGKAWKDARWTTTES